MPDPNDTLNTIQMLCADVAKSKTALGYNGDLMRRVGTYVFGSLDAVRDAIQAPDGQSWRAATMGEAAKRGEVLAVLENEAIEHERKAELAINSLHCGDSSMTVSSFKRTAEIHKFAATAIRAAIAKATTSEDVGGTFVAENYGLCRFSNWAPSHAVGIIPTRRFGARRFRMSLRVARLGQNSSCLIGG